ncbi:MAG: PilZ domain-containing protein [Candidatus Lambdaproteobacteria bacterium]|nr:PilZ domain-containing protein [Candidatus Lambdaproteobacteria bacterium]
MDQQRYFWVFDRTIFDQIRLPEVTWTEGALIAAALCGFAGYLFFIRYLDHRVQQRMRRERHAAHLERLLEKAALEQHEMDTLADLAGGRDFDHLYPFMTRPERFEAAVHDAIRRGHGGRLGFIDVLRGRLGFHSDNLRAPVVSTRQLEPGDSMRITIWEGGLPHHFYGTIRDVGLHTFTVTLREDALKAILRAPGDCELYHVRGLDVEYRFPCRFIRENPSAGALRIYHALVQEAHGARRTRLPLLRDIDYQLVQPHMDMVSDLDPELAPSPAMPALLFDLSEGGFAIVTDNPVPEGRLVRINLPLKKGRGRLTLSGRIKESRAFSGNQWFTRCETRGLSSSQRNYLQQILRMEHQRRQKTMAPVRRAARADATPPEHAAPAQPPGPSAHSSN